MVRPLSMDLLTIFIISTMSILKKPEKWHACLCLKKKATLFLKNLKVKFTGLLLPVWKEFRTTSVKELLDNK